MFWNIIILEHSVVINFANLSKQPNFTANSADSFNKLGVNQPCDLALKYSNHVSHYSIRFRVWSRGKDPSTHEESTTDDGTNLLIWLEKNLRWMFPKISCLWAKHRVRFVMYCCQNSRPCTWCRGYPRGQTDSDIPYEGEIQRHPYQVKCWMRYVEHKQNTRAPTAAVNMVYERALKELPGRWVELDVFSISFTKMYMLCHLVHVATSFGTTTWNIADIMYEQGKCWQP